jgi:hypothetical protein
MGCEPEKVINHTEKPKEKRYVQICNERGLGGLGLDKMVTVEVAHADGLRHETGQIFVFKDDSFKEILISKRGPSPLVHAAPGKYQPSAAGHIGDRTSTNLPEAAYDILKRQLFYEFEKLPSGIALVKLLEYPNNCTEKEEISNLEYTHLYRTVYPGPFSLDPEKLVSTSFIPMEALLKDVEIEEGKAGQDNQYSIKYTLSLVNAVEQYKKHILRHR